MSTVNLLTHTCIEPNSSHSNLYYTASKDCTKDEFDAVENQTLCTLLTEKGGPGSETYQKAQEGFLKFFPVYAESKPPEWTSDEVNLMANPALRERTDMYGEMSYEEIRVFQAIDYEEIMFACSETSYKQSRGDFQLTGE